MKSLKLLALTFIVVAALSSCTSTRFGLANSPVPLPASVTLHVGIAPVGIVINNMNMLTRDLWELANKANFTANLTSVNTARARSIIERKLTDAMPTLSDLFTVSGSLTTEVPYNKPADSPADFSGFDFMQFADQIKTPYVLSFYVTEWGYEANDQYKTHHGCFMKLNMQLVDVKTNKTMWEAKDAYYRSLGDIQSMDITKDMMRDGVNAVIAQEIDFAISKLRK